MRDNIYENASKLFYDISNKEPSEFSFHLTGDADYPKIEKLPSLHAVVPLPRQIDDRYYFEGVVTNLEQLQDSEIWSLFLASVYHVAGHAAVTDYSVYESWLNGKQDVYCKKAIEYIEDKKVENYLRNNFPEIWECILPINSYYDTLYQKNFKPKTDKSRENFRDFFKLEKTTELKIDEDILAHQNNPQKLVEFAEYLYRNKHLLPSYQYPYCNQTSFNPLKNRLPKEGFKVNSEFKKTANFLSELWVDQEVKKLKMIKKYEKNSQDLEFDEIDYSPENFKEYLKLKDESSLLIKKIKTQLQSITNIIDDPVTEDLGLVEMQKAIQAIASKNPRISIFEQDEEKRHEESWAIIMDTSASMKLSFTEFKKFALCLSEAAETLNSRYGNWSLYCYNNKFYIVKDSKERFNQQIKARIGGIQNEGLSFIPDAITLAARMMKDDVNDKKYIFLISDGTSLGYDKVSDKFTESIEYAKNLGIRLIGVGIPEKLSDYFTVSFSDSETRKAVSKFINAYVYVAKMDL